MGRNRVQRPPPSAVEIYQHCNYRGRSARLGFGNYNYPTPIGNDQMSAIKVPAGFTVILYEHANFAGAKWVIKGPWNGSCFWSHQRWWNDRVSSIKVLPTTSYRPPNPPNPCGKSVAVTVPYGIGRKTLTSCKRYSMNSSTHVVDFTVTSAGGVQVHRAQPFCGQSENFNLSHGLGNRKLQRCKTYNLNSKNNLVSLTTLQNGSVKYNSVKPYGKHISIILRNRFINTRFNYLTNPFFNKQIRGRPNGRVDGTINRLSWERYDIQDAGNNHIYMENATHRGKYLACRSNGTVYLSRGKVEESKWVLINEIDGVATGPNETFIRSSIHMLLLAVEGERNTQQDSNISAITFDKNQFMRIAWDIAPYDSLRLMWSNSKPVPGAMSCLKIENSTESAWNNTYLCTSHEIGLKWAKSNAEKESLVKQGYKATQIIEAAEPKQNQWDNKWLCVPEQSFVEFKWTSSNAGRAKLEKEGFNVVRWDVPRDPHTWADNYLGYKMHKKVYSNSQMIGAMLNLQAGGWNTGWCRSQPKTNQFFQATVNNKLLMSRSGNPKVRSGRGLNLVATDQYGNPIRLKSYDTHGVAQDSDTFIKDVTQSLNDKNVTTIIIGTTDEAVNRLKNSVRSFMASRLGANYFSYLEYRGSYLMVFNNSEKKVAFEAINNCDMIKFVSKCDIFCPPVFNAEWYLAHNPDLSAKMGSPSSIAAQKSAKDHWASTGRKEGRQASPTFFVKDYLDMYPDLQKAFGRNYEQAIQHYIDHGIAEGRRGVLFTSKNNKYGLLSNHLQCYLDARQPESYPGKGNVWKDLTGNNKNFTWNKVPAFDDGRFKYIGSSQAKGPASSSFGLGNGKDGYAVIVVSRQRTMSKNRPFNFQSNASHRVGVAVHQTWDNTNTYFDNMGWTIPGKNRIYTNIGDKWNRTCVWAYVRTVTGQLKIYCNGALLKSIDGGAYPLNLSNLPAIINQYGWNADISVFAVYNFGLLDRHIKNIYDWWVSSEKQRRIERDVGMANKLKKTLQGFPVPLGLQLYLDANYKESYPGTGKVFKDLSPYGRNFTFQKQPQFLGNRIKTTGRNKLTGPPSSSFNFDESDNYTIVWYGKTNSLSTNSVFQMYGNHSHNRGVFCHPTWTNQVMYFDQAGCCNSSQRLTANVKGYWNKMCVYALVKDSYGRHLYINGTKVASTKDRGLIINLNLRNMEILVTERYPIWNAEFAAFMVFNKGLGAEQIQDIQKWLVSGYVFKDYSWDRAAQYCTEQGMTLCNYKDYCPQGPGKLPVYPLPKIDTWAPVSDSHNQWVQLGDARMCKLHTDVCKGPNQWCDKDGKPKWGNQSRKEGFRKAFMCCSPPKVQVYFDTIGKISETSCIMFKNTKYMRYNFRNHISDNVHDIKDLKFEGIFTEGKFDACLEYPNTNTLHVFKDMLVTKFDYVKNTTSKPVAINTLYPGLPLEFQRGNFDAIYRVNPNKFYIFKGTNVVIYNEMNHSAQLRPLSKVWPGLTSTFASGRFTAVLGVSSYHRVIFKEDLYTVYTSKHSMRGPYNVVPNWRGLKEPFIRNGEVCLIYTAQVNYLKSQISKNQDNRALVTQAKRQLDHYQTLLNQKCNFISYSTYIRDLEAKKARLKKLKQDILNSQKSQEEKMAALKKIDEELKKLNVELANLNIKIGIEKQKKCPEGEEGCKDNSPFVSATDDRKCTSDMVKSMLQQANISAEEIGRVGQYLDYKPNVNNYDIEKHPEYYKYTQANQVRKCLDFVPPEIPAEEQAAAVSEEDRDRALDILKRAMAEYGRRDADRQIKQEEAEKNWLELARLEAQRLGMNCNPEQLKLLALSLQIRHNVRKSKQLSTDTKEIIMQIKGNPNYRKLLEDIEKIRLELTLKKALKKKQAELVECRKYNLVDKMQEIITHNKQLM
jgi:hypothetical protein